MPTPEPFAVTRTDPAYVVVEIFAGDNNLANFVTRDLQETLQGLGDDGAMLALVDHASRPTEILEISGSHARQLLLPGEINTGDAATLTDFLARALVTYPASIPLAIGFWDHGSGVVDEQDPDEAIVTLGIGTEPRPPKDRRLRPSGRLFGPAIEADIGAEAMLHDDTDLGVLTTREAGSVVTTALRRAARGPVAAIFSDTCLNGMVEVLHELAPAADCIIGSEALEPGDGWDYTRFLRLLRAPYDAAAWGKAAVDAYGECYRTRTDDHPCTMGAFRSTNAMVPAFKALVAAASAAGKPAFDILNQARSATTAFDRRDVYDLIEFAGHVRAAATGPLADAAQQLESAATAARIGNVAMGPTVTRAQGLSFWFPRSTSSFQADRTTYARLAFDRDTGWTQLLDQHL
ncbi:hypothetical protein ACFB49_07370 [Sphingomonas sp. DBB INV C78]|uniref:clostripain-related cysteine peptidase n=1 Tax=Sphingomonas sp. DBB INV C78 TaxID=3349434 RepID=UPI0036D2EC29